MLPHLKLHVSLFTQQWSEQTPLQGALGVPRKTNSAPLLRFLSNHRAPFSSSDSEASPGSDGEGLAERTSCSFGSPDDLTPGPCEPSPPASMEEIQVELQCADLWKRFHDIGTEMIITKAGRYTPHTRAKQNKTKQNRQTKKPVYLYQNLAAFM